MASVWSCSTGKDYREQSRFHKCGSPLCFLKRRGGEERKMQTCKIGGRTDRSNNEQEEEQALHRCILSLVFQTGRKTETH